LKLTGLRNNTRRGSNPSLYAYQLHGHQYIQIKLGGKYIARIVNITKYRYGISNYRSRTTLKLMNSTEA
jgi:hypothetical protein